jgi:hypothetical protein
MPPDPAPLPDFIPLAAGTKAPGGLPDFIPAEKPDARPLANQPDETGVSGTLKNIGTSIIKGLPHVPSPANPVFASDLGELASYVMARGKAALTGKPIDQVLAEHADLMKKVQASKPSWLPSLSPPSGEDVTKPILDKTGEYTPTTALGRAGSSAVQVATGMGPGKLAGLGKRLLVGGLSGGVGETATEYTGDPLAGIVAGGAVPSAVAKAGSVAAKTARPYMPSQNQSRADELMLKNTRNPERAIADLAFQPKEIVPGSKASTAEVTMDPGHIIADKMAKAQSTEYQQTAKSRETAQNTARRGVVESLADPNADPVEVANAFRQHLSDVETDHAKTVADLDAKAKARSAGVTGMAAEDVGKSLREEVTAKDNWFKTYFKKAYDAIDPDGKLNVLAHPVVDKAIEILNRPNRDLEPESKLSQSALEKARGLDHVVSFDRLRTLDASLTKMMAEARRTSDPGYHDIVQLKGAVKDAFANAVENQVKYEADQVARGALHPEDTFAHKLRQQVESYYADKAQSAAATGTGEDGAVRSGGVSGASGTGGGPGTAGGGEGLPRPNLEPDTAQRLAAVNKEYGEYRSLYGAEPLAGALKTTGFKDQFKVPDAAVAAKAFPAGDGGYQATSRWLEGTGKSSQSLADVKAIAIARLRDMMKGDTVTPEALNAWRAKYAPALRAIDEASPGFTDSFNNAASTTRALNRALVDQKLAVADAQKGVAAKFLGLQDASDVTAMVGKALNAPNSGQQIGQLVDRVGKNPVALAGLKKAATDWLLGKASNAGVTQADEHVLSAPRLGNFVRDNPDAIRKLWGEDGLRYLKTVAGDMGSVAEASDCAGHGRVRYGVQDARQNDRRSRRARAEWFDYHRRRDESGGRRRSVRG